MTTKKNSAIKRADGEPLTRADIQYDLLYDIFHDPYEVFTDPYPSDDVSSAKICFGDLYIKTILHSPKATKALKDKMMVSKEFAEDFGMLALLVNVGKVNTTMSFFPEMKTSIRTYHPIPVLQRTTGNLHDAPRIKHILKSSVLRNEVGVAPSTPAEVLESLKEKKIPPTTVTNLIFMLANHSLTIGHSHLPGELDFMDIFFRENISSKSRAQAFLWLCYNYLESPSTNNKDDHGGGNPFSDNGQVDPPSFTFLSKLEITEENIDLEDEKILGNKLVVQRNEILKAQSVKDINKYSQKEIPARSIISEDDESVLVVSQTKSKGKRPIAKSNTPVKVKGPSKRLHLTEDGQEQKGQPSIVRSTDLQISHERASSPAPSYHQRRRRSERLQPFEAVHPPSDISDQYIHHRRHSPCRKRPDADFIISCGQSTSKTRFFRSTSPPPRSFLDQTWRNITTKDPLVDSDSEVGDQFARQDYIRRLRVIDMFCQEPSLKSC